jgi:micrococcal nuclease
MKKSAWLVIGVFGVLFNSVIAFSWELNEFVPFEDIGLSSKSDPLGSPRKELVNFSINGHVKRISDGDTVTLVGANDAQFVIRLSDIDTPEIEHNAYTPSSCNCKTIPFRPGQKGGVAATEALKKLIAVEDTVKAECYEIDQYGRIVCHIFKGSTNVNLEMIKNGWGWLPNNSAWIRDPESRSTESKAKAQKKGAWALENQVSPATWRKLCWEDGNCEGAE